MERREIHVAAYALRLAAAILFAGAAAAEGDGYIQQQLGSGSGSCSCVCYDRCARGEGGLSESASLLCFVDCVLKYACVCPRPGDPRDAADALPATLHATVRLLVDRRRHSRVSGEEAAEVLRLEVAADFASDDDTTAKFDVYVSRVEVRHHQQLVGRVDLVAGHGDRMVLARKEFPIGDALSKIGAGGDPTVMVSLVPMAAGHILTVQHAGVEYFSNRNSMHL